MTAETAARVRDTVLPPPLRTGSALCACQSGPTTHCRWGEHARCHRAAPQRVCETWVLRRDGGVAHLRDLYTHPTVSITGTWRTATAMVWLADRTCRWVCGCECHSAPAPPRQVALFEIGGAL